MKDVLKKVVVFILTQEAKLLLRRKKPTIIAVTGNVGKTSTKDAVYCVLKNKVKARKNQKSFNSEIGVPLTVLGLQTAWNSPIGWLKNVFEGFFVAILTKDYPKVLVLEAGVDRPGDMKSLTTWVKPDVVVLTRLPDVPTHVEYFSTPEEVVNEKLELVKALKDDGVLIYNHDDGKIRQAVEEVRQKSYGYSRYSSSHFTASNDRLIYDGSTPIGMEFTMNHLDDEVTCKVKGSVGTQHTYSYGAAMAVGHLFDVDLETAAAALAEHLPPVGRTRLLEGINNSLIIDDTYNSSPTACERAIQTLSEIKGAKRKIAVLGDMLELGQFSVREHERMGELVAKEVDLLLTVGVRARKIAEGALENGLSEKKILQYDDVDRAGRELSKMVKTGDVILVKASQGIRAEKVVAKILKETEKMDSLLVRQEAHWIA